MSVDAQLMSGAPQSALRWSLVIAAVSVIVPLGAAAVWLVLQPSEAVLEVTGWEVIETIGVTENAAPPKPDDLLTVIVQCRIKGEVPHRISAGKSAWSVERQQFALTSTDGPSYAPSFFGNELMLLKFVSGTHDVVLPQCVFHIRRSDFKAPMQFSYEHFPPVSLEFDSVPPEARQPNASRESVNDVTSDDVMPANTEGFVRNEKLLEVEDAADAQVPPLSTDEIDARLNGLWTMKKVYLLRERGSEEYVLLSSMYEMSIENGLVTFVYGSDDERTTETHSLSSDRESSPYRYRMERKDADGAGELQTGIYRLQADVLWMCFQNAETVPEDFTISEQQDGRRIYEFVRRH